MHHFFVTPEQIEDGVCRIAGRDVNHIKNVLRMKPGEQITVRDGVSGSYLCQLETIGAGEVLARVLSVQENDGELPAQICLFQGLPKGDKMELVVQKAVELGAYEIVPVATRRSVVKLDEKKAEAKVRRWSAIAESAANQSGRALIPRVAPVMSFSQALEYAAEFDCCLIPYELARGMAETKAVVRSLKPGMKIGVFIGPEGGFDADEVDLAREGGVLPVTLGRRILRTETAGLAALSILMFHLENDPAS